jgi:organic radical activating enzyme
MLESIRGIHLEPTNICTLKCPRCSRTEFIKKFPKKWKNLNLNFEDLKNFLDIDLKGKLVALNGNYGDPLYYPDLIPLIKYFKSAGCNIIITTNGSYASNATWEQLAEILDETDVVNFSIDGVPENFTQYRVNADWPSIERGISIMTKSRAKTVWKFIVFSYNINDIETAQQLSKNLGINEFVLNNSDRWDDVNDWLNPKRYVDTGYKTETGILSNGSFDGNRNDSIIQWKNSNNKNDINPVCKITHSMHFISASGFYLPCCWMGDHRFYYESDFYKQKEKFAISKTTLSQVINNLKDFYNNIETIKPKACTFNCPKS